METVTISPSAPEDFLVIKGIDCRPLPMERESIYFLFGRFLRNICFTAKSGGKIVGFLLGFISQVDPSEAYLHYLFVDPEHRRLKIGSRLTAAFLDAVRRAGCRRVWLITSNPDNVRFYEKLGFAVGTPPERDRAIGEYQRNHQKMIHMVWKGAD